MFFRFFFVICHDTIEPPAFRRPKPFHSSANILVHSQRVQIFCQNRRFLQLFLHSRRRWFRFFRWSRLSVLLLRRRVPVFVVVLVARILLLIILLLLLLRLLSLRSRRFRRRQLILNERISQPFHVLVPSDVFSHLHVIFVRDVQLDA